jgi:hypothetical protein
MSETDESLPDGMMMVQAFDLERGGYQYSVTGPQAPERCAFAYFKTREQAVRHALHEPDPPTPNHVREE